jgi:hypothetical protein
MVPVLHGIAIHASKANNLPPSPLMPMEIDTSTNWVDNHEIGPKSVPKPEVSPVRALRNGKTRYHADVP